MGDKALTMEFSENHWITVFGIAADIIRVGLFFMLWNQFVPVVKNIGSRKMENPDVCFPENEIAALFILLAVMQVMNSFMEVRFPVFMAEMAGILIAYILFRRRGWLAATCFCLLLFWNISSLCYFIVNSLTNRPFTEMMAGVENAANLKHFVEVRITAMQVILYLLYIFFWTLAVLPVMRIVKKREIISAQEMGFLSVQNVAGIILTLIMTRIAVLSVDSGAVILTEKRPELLWEMPIIALLMYFGELSAIFMWQENNENRKKSELYLAEKIEKEAMKKRLDDTQRYYEKIRKVRHDLAIHLTNIRGLSEHGFEKELAAYIEDFDADIKSIEMSVSTGNPVTDMVINDHFQKAKEADVVLSVNMRFEDEWKISAYDMGIVIGNILDNAIREASKVTGRDRTVSFQIKENPGVVLLMCENSYVTDIEDVSKSEWHGLGLKNVEEIAERYDGGMRITEEEGIFSVVIMLKKGK